MAFLGQLEWVVAGGIGRVGGTKAQCGDVESPVAASVTTSHPESTRAAAFWSDGNGLRGRIRRRYGPTPGPTSGASKDGGVEVGDTLGGFGSKAWQGSVAGASDFPTPDVRTPRAKQEVARWGRWTWKVCEPRATGRRRRTTGGASFGRGSEVHSIPPSMACIQKEELDGFHG